MMKKYSVVGAMININNTKCNSQTFCLGDAIKNIQIVTEDTWFEIASLSKSIGSCLAIEYFTKNNISLETPINKLLSETQS